MIYRVHLHSRRLSTKTTIYKNNLTRSFSLTKCFKFVYALSGFELVEFSKKQLDNTKIPFSFCLEGD